MRFHFPKLDRPKKAAKRISRLLEGGAKPLSKVQNGLAVALGYRDWHELEVAHNSHPPAALDQDLDRESYHQRSAELVLRLATSLGVSDSEAQYGLLASRLTGDLATAEDQLAIRMLCWRSNRQWPLSGWAGTVVRTRHSFGTTRGLVMLTADYNDRTGGIIHYISDNSRGICARSDISIPRDPLLPFIPHRLRIAYGMYIETDGAKVLFSRDYAPMWRLREGQLPQQVPPTEWIRFERQEWFWQADAPWDDKRRLEEEEQRLASYGIHGLPALVDLLPIMVSSVGNVPSPRSILREMQAPKALAG